MPPAGRFAAMVKKESREGYVRGFGELKIKKAADEITSAAEDYRFRASSADNPPGT